MAKFLPYGRQNIDDDDIAAVVRTLKSDFLTTGPEVAAFEAEFAEAVGVKEAVVVNSGTAALHLACLAAGLGAGDVALVPAITFLSTANAVRMCGADVQFVDCDVETGLITAETVEAAISSCERAGDIKAILPVHLNGHLVDMRAITEIATARNLTVISDCCHALGAEYHDGGKAGDGRFEHFGAFSTHPVKTIAMGEGGVVTTNDHAKAEKMRRLRSHGMTRNPEDWRYAPNETAPWYYEASDLGYNYRAPDILCALGRSQLRKLPDFLVKRRMIAGWYDDALSGFGHEHLAPVPRSPGLSGWHLYAVRVDFDALGVTRSQVMEQLRAVNIGTQVHYIPVCDQPYYIDLYGRQDMPGARRYYNQILSLPIYVEMEKSDVEYVVRQISEILEV